MKRGERMKESLEEVVKKVEASAFLTACKNCSGQVLCESGFDPGEEEEEISSWML